MSGAWPWWAGGAGLALAAVGSCVVGRRSFGVSGALGRFVNWRDELAAERAGAAMGAAGEAALEAALAAATAEAFAGWTPAPAGPGLGPDPGHETPRLATPEVAPSPTGSAGPAALPGGRGALAARPPLGAHAAFLVAIVAGASLVSALRGDLRLSLAPPEAFARLVAPGGWGLLALGAGGLLIGAGSSLSGGCTMGHGLSGCARLQPASLVATATFLAVAVGVSFLLAGRLP